MLIEISLFAFGAIIGSFLSVCIYRIPLGRESGLEGLVEEEGDDESIEEEHDVVFIPNNIDPNTISINHPKRSFCTNCGETLSWWHNIPIVSWLILGGKCKFCKEKISVRYPIVEALSGTNALFSFTLFPTVTAVVVFLFVSMLIVISFIDIDYYIIPNVITYPTFIIGCALISLNHFVHIFPEPLVPDVFQALYGLLAGAGILIVISEGYMKLRKKQGLGMGDVKLLALTGVFFGPQAALYTIFIGSLLGSLIGVTLIVLSRGNLSNYLPFGPYLAAANALFIFTGPDLLIKINESLITIIRGIGSY